MSELSIPRLAPLNLGLLLFFAINPYPKWMLPNGYVQVFFFLTTIYVIAKGNFILAKNKRKIVMAIVTYIIYFTLPLVHEFKSGYFLYYLIFLELLFFDFETYVDGYLVLKKIIFYVCCFSLFVWIIHLAGFSLPHYHYIPDFRQSSLDNYHIYGPCISLYRGNHFIGGGLERICGVFAEPGHFGIYLGLLFAIEKFEFDTKENIIMLITGVLTFSTAFYGIICLGLVYRIISSSRKMSFILKISIIGFIFLPILLSTTLFYKTVFGRVLNNQQNDEITVSTLVENRTSLRTKEVYYRFSVGKTFLIGNGMSEHEIIQITNWRGFVFRYGIIGVIIAFALVLIITHGPSFRYQILLIAIAILIFSHRSYILYSPGIYMLLYIATVISNNSEPKNDLFAIDLE